jgi:hypothetical protein
MNYEHTSMAVTHMYSAHISTDIAWNVAEGCCSPHKSIQNWGQRTLKSQQLVEWSTRFKYSHPKFSLEAARWSLKPIKFWSSADLYELLMNAHLDMIFQIVWSVGSSIHLEASSKVSTFQYYEKVLLFIRSKNKWIASLFWFYYS